jgi:transposase
MVTPKKKSKPLSTIWEVNDELWNIIQAILDEHDPPAKTGRPRIEPRPALNGIIYQARSGVQWNQLPIKFGDDSSVHRTLQRWVAKEIFACVWALLVENCAELGGVDWNWQCADGALGKARFGGIRSAPTPQIAANRARNAA